MNPKLRYNLRLVWVIGIRGRRPLDALRLLFPRRYFIMAVDHPPTSHEIAHAEGFRAFRERLPPDERHRYRSRRFPIVTNTNDESLKAEQMADYLHNLKHGIGWQYTYPENDDGRNG
jgi:hypothetical protein